MAALWLTCLLSLFSFLNASLIDNTTNALIAQFLPIPSNDTARSHLYNLTQEPHLAGTYLAGNNATIQYMVDKFTAYGFEVEVQTFQSLVNYPVERAVQLLPGVGPGYNATLQEPALDVDPTSNNSDSVPTFHGYGKSGDVTAELMYVNYGSFDDFKFLAENNISVAGKIVIARYGTNFRGVKVQQAQQNGAIGIIIYSDPADDGPRAPSQSYPDGLDAYPDGPMRPEDGVQRGSCLYLQICPGDPRRVQQCLNNASAQPEGNLMPGIPVTPISYADALPLLEALGGNAVNQSWIGGLPITYRYGPSTDRVRLYVNNTFEVRTLTNVLGTIKGTGDQADELVILGNHRDAWVFGAFDPSSGTSAMLETARGLGQLMAGGWKPKRTIVFASWDGEEYGLLGSTYYGELLAEKLQSKAVAYLNVDVAVTGPSFGIQATPSLISLIREITTKLTDPRQNKSLSEVWNGNVDVLGSGSDYTVFIHHLGVPSLSYGFGGPEGVYHSIYDSFTWMDLYGDPGFYYHQVAAQFFGAVGIAVSESQIAPLNYLDTAAALRNYLAQTNNSLAGYNNTVDLTPLAAAIDTFSAKAIVNSALINKTQNGNIDSEDAEDINEQLFATERLFLDSVGLPLRFWYKHTLQAPGITKGYGSDVFPGLAWAIQIEDWALAANQVSRISARINAASSNLGKDPLDDSDDDDHLGLILGLVLGMAALIAIVVFCVYRRHQRKESADKVNLGQGYDALSDTS